MLELFISFLCLVGATAWYVSSRREARRLDRYANGLAGIARLRRNMATGDRP